MSPFSVSFNFFHLFGGGVLFSIMIFWIDSLSRPIFFDKLRKTRDLFARCRNVPIDRDGDGEIDSYPEGWSYDVNCYDFTNYNSVAGGTQNNAPPFMCGNQYFNCPMTGENWIWEVAKKEGYATLFSAGL